MLTESAFFQVRMTLGHYLQGPLNAAPSFTKALLLKCTCGCDGVAFSVFGAKDGNWDFTFGLLCTASRAIVALYV